MEQKERPASRAELRGLLDGCRRAGIGLTVLTALQSVLWVLLALVSRGVLNSAQRGGSLRVWSAGLALLAVAIPLARGITSLWSGCAADHGASSLRQRLLELLQRKDCESVNSYHSGYLFSRMAGDCRTICSRYVSLLPGIIGQAIQLLGAAVVLAVLQPKLAGIVLLCGGAALLGGVLLHRVLKARHLILRRADDRLAAFLQEHLEQLELCRSIAGEEEIGRRAETCQQDWLRARSGLRWISVGGSTAFSLAVQLSSAAVIVWGALAIRSGSLTFGDLTAILQLLNLFRSPVSGLTGIQGQLAAVSAAEERLLQLWDLPDEPAGLPVADDAVCRALVFDDVTFCYEGEEQPVFRHFSARVEWGQWTCLTGASGRGKSTLYRLILGLYRPQEGHILLETDRGMVECSAATRKLFSFVPQMPILFSGTLRENLLLTKPSASDGELWAVLDRAECGFVRELADGLDTALGETGQGLSVGQRQRIAIARALLSDARMLLLDEITASLDRETEERLLQKLRKTYPSAMIATHRPASLADEGLAFLDLSPGTDGTDRIKTQAGRPRDTWSFP